MNVSGVLREALSESITIQCATDKLWTAESPR
jgi:hypothetical protein